MVAPVFIPPPIRRSRKCPRCGLRYPQKRDQCPHCTGLSERELEQLKARAAERHEAHANLGKLFLALGLLVAVALAILWT